MQTCESLLHVAKTQLPSVLAKMCEATVNGGAIYISFKHGNFEGERNGRYFLDITPETFGELIMSVPGLELVEEWFTEDVRTEISTMWYNTMLKKK